MNPAAAPLRLAILISGRGSNMVAIASACASGSIPAQVSVVISDQAGAAGIPRARQIGLETRIVAARDFRTPAGLDRQAFETALADAIDAAQAQFIVLAGFMRVLSADFVHRYAGRMLNIHPSLLPKFPGLDTHTRALAAGESRHGASVHFVTAELDAGPVVLQGPVAVVPDDTVDTLSARVHAVEHRIYPMVIGWIASGRLVWNAGAPLLDGEPLAVPRQLPEG